MCFTHLDMGTSPPEMLSVKLKLLARMFVFQQAVKLGKQELALEDRGSQKHGCLHFGFSKFQC